MKSTQNKTIEEGTIIRQVEKICRSNEFRSKRLLCEFLSYVVSEDLAGRGSEIKGYSIGVDVFGKDVDFDPGEDALVRIHAGRLRRMLDVYYLKSGRNDPIRIEIPKGNYTPVFTDNLAVVASEEKPGLPDLTKQKPVSSSLVILPFQNLTGNPDHDYFALGFSEDLSVEFSKFEDLIIYSCSTCRIYKEDFSELRHNFCEKGIRFLIEGSVMHADDQLKVVVKLVDIFENRQLWAERYVKQLTLDNLNDIQENIAKEISRVVGGEYGLILQKLSAEANRARPQNLDTYSAMLKYYYFLAQQTPESARQAFGALQHALEKEPVSAIAMALIASMYGNRYSLDYPGAEKAYLETGRLAEKAAEIDPNNSMVMASLVYKCFLYEEKSRFLNLVDQVLAMVRNHSFRLASVAFHLSLYGEWERGNKLLKQALQTCQGLPMYLYGATTLYYYRNNQYEEALEQACRYDVPSLFWGPMLRAAVCGQLNKLEEASENVTNVIGLKPDFESKAGYLISRYVKEPGLVEHVLEGLRKAGMNL